MLSQVAKMRNDERINHSIERCSDPQMPIDRVKCKDFVTREVKCKEKPMASSAICDGVFTEGKHYNLCPTEVVVAANKRKEITLAHHHARVYRIRHNLVIGHEYAAVV